MSNVFKLISKASKKVMGNFGSVSLYSLLFCIICNGVLFGLFYLAMILLGENGGDFFSWLFTPVESGNFFLMIALTILLIEAKIAGCILVLFSIWQFIIAPFIVAYQGGILKLIRDGNTPDVSDLFRNYTPACISTMVGMYIRIALWCLVFVIPGIVKWLSYSMTPFVIADKSNKEAHCGAISFSSKLMKGSRMKLLFLRILCGLMALAVFLISLILMFAFNLDGDTGMVISIVLAVIVYAFLIVPIQYGAEAKLYTEVLDAFHGKNLNTDNITPLI